MVCCRGSTSRGCSYGPSLGTSRCIYLGSMFLCLRFYHREASGSCWPSYCGKWSSCHKQNNRNLRWYRSLLFVLQICCDTGAGRNFTPSTMNTPSIPGGTRRVTDQQAVEDLGKAI